MSIKNHTNEDVKTKSNPKSKYNYMKPPNITYLNSIADGDEKFRIRFINILKTEFPQEVEAYLAMYGEKQYDNAADIVHKIKHKFNICGMIDGYQLAVKYEEELRKGTKNNHPDFFSFLKVADRFIKTL